MSAYKLTYFNFPGIAEPIRFIFKYAKVPFEDIRIKYDANWSKEKPKYPWGSLPVLEENGEVLSQSYAIARYLAKKYNLAGKDSWELAKCDEYVDTVKDLYMQCLPIFLTEDEDKKKEIRERFIEKEIPKFLSRFEKELEGKEFLVGNCVTFADFVLSHYCEMFGEIMLNPNYIDKYPVVKKHMENVFSIPEIKKWREERPKVEY